MKIIVKKTIETGYKDIIEGTTGEVTKVDNNGRYHISIPNLGAGVFSKDEFNEFFKTYNDGVIDMREEVIQEYDEIEHGYEKEELETFCCGDEDDEYTADDNHEMDYYEDLSREYDEKREPIITVKPVNQEKKTFISKVKGFFGLDA